MSNIEQEIQNIIDYQNNPKFHPLTCGNDSNHTPLVPVDEAGKIVLICVDCDYKQNYIPEIATDNNLNTIKWKTN